MFYIHSIIGLSPFRLAYKPIRQPLAKDSPTVHNGGKRTLNHHRFGTLPASLHSFMTSLIGTFGTCFLSDRQSIYIHLSPIDHYSMLEVSQTGDDSIFSDENHAWAYMVVV